jgi:hypothetical protein
MKTFCYYKEVTSLKGMEFLYQTIDLLYLFHNFYLVKSINGDIIHTETEYPKVYPDLREMVEGAMYVD